MNTPSPIPSISNPVVKVGNEFRGIYLPPHSYDSDLQVMAEGDLGAHG